VTGIWCFAKHSSDKPMAIRPLLLLLLIIVVTSKCAYFYRLPLNALWGSCFDYLVLLTLYIFESTYCIEWQWQQSKTKAYNCRFLHLHNPYLASIGWLICRQNFVTFLLQADRDCVMNNIPLVSDNNTVPLIGNCMCVSACCWNTWQLHNN
jgi:hypothetical protein